MSEEKKPIEAKAEAAPAVAEKTEERPTGEMAAIKATEADAPKMPVAKGPSKDAHVAAKSESKAEAKPASKIEPKAEPEAAAKPAPTAPAAPTPAKPEPEPVQSSRTTMTMPAAIAVGAPPDVPGDVENPTQMPGPDEVPTGSPTDAAKPPGNVPSGDSRSLRRGADFALVYRQGSAVISRFGAIGQRGQWRVVEYPTPSSASNAYAKECSRFVGEGFSDYRD